MRILMEVIHIYKYYQFKNYVHTLKTLPVVLVYISYYILVDLAF